MQLRWQKTEQLNDFGGFQAQLQSTEHNIEIKELLNITSPALNKIVLYRKRSRGR